METLLVFVKNPEPGQVKTRLAKGVGEETAASLYRAFLEDTVSIAKHWKDDTAGYDPNRRVVLMTSPAPTSPFLNELADRCGARVVEQTGEGLGERLQNAFSAAFAGGARSVCAIGSDAPSLPPRLISDAFRALLWEDAVIGPTFDGGYWLIGLQQMEASLFDDISWSTDAVFAQTVAKLQESSTSIHLLPYWHDVDVKEDLQRVQIEMALRPSGDLQSEATREMLGKLRDEGVL